MGLNFSVPLPGPFSYSARVGGGRPGPSSQAQIEALRAQRAVSDLYCPAHLRIANAIGWAMLAVSGLVAVVITWWALPVWGILAALTWGRHQFRHQRRAPLLQLLATGQGCDRCRIDAERAGRRAELNPLGQLPLDQTQPIPTVKAA